jgi:hypothetical protein
MNSSHNISEQPKVVKRLILSANLLEGYSKQFRMATPMEVMYEEE